MSDDVMKKIAYRLKHAAGVYRDMDDDAAADQCMEYADELLAPRLDDIRDLREENIKLRADLRRYYLKEYEESTDNSLLDNPREHDYLGQYKSVDLEDIETGGCMFCGHEDLWFDRTFADHGGGPCMHDICSNCARPQLNPDELVALWERDYTPPDTQRPDITMHFYADDPDSMRRYRLMNKAEWLMIAVREFDEWLRRRVEYNPDPGEPLHIPADGIDYLIIAREQFLMRLADYDINIWEDL